MICILLNGDGTITPTADTPETCAGSLLLSPGDVGTFNLIEQAFAAPTPSEAASWVVGGFGAVLGAYIVGRLVGSIVAMFK